MWPDEQSAGIAHRPPYRVVNKDGSVHCVKRNTLVRFIAIYETVKLVQFRVLNISRRSQR